MAKINYSIIACQYGNAGYLKNFLWTVSNQNYKGRFETIIVDNGTEGRELASTCNRISQKACAEFIRIKPANKTCTNISQGINLAADKASGRYLIIVADPNVLLSFNLISKIDAAIKPQNVVISAGPQNDVKISPDGSQQTEYAKLPVDYMHQQNEALLKKMGWPADPLSLKLVPGTYRFPPPHLGYDCYIVATSRMNFYKFGGYPTAQSTWGRYHDIFTETLCAKLTEVRLNNIRIIHQFHRVYKDDLHTSD